MHLPEISLLQSNTDDDREIVGMEASRELEEREANEYRTNPARADNWGGDLLNDNFPSEITFQLTKLEIDFTIASGLFFEDNP